MKESCPSEKNPAFNKFMFLTFHEGFFKNTGQETVVDKPCISLWVDFHEKCLYQLIYFV